MKADAIEALRHTLHLEIENWVRSICESDSWESCSAYFGDNTISLMTDAAIAVLKSVVDVQDFLRAQGDIK